MESFLVFSVTWVAVFAQSVTLLVALCCVVGNPRAKSTAVHRGLIRLATATFIVAAIFPLMFEVVGAGAAGLSLDTILFFTWIVGVHVLHRLLFRKCIGPQGDSANG